MVASRFLNADAARQRFGALADTYAASLDRGDPPADAAVEALHELGHGAWWDAVQAILDKGAAAAGAPAPVAALLASLPPVPSDAEQAVYEHATAAVARTGESAGLVLQCASLLVDYWSPAFSKPLVLTGSLLDDTGHRIARTAAWWIELHKPLGVRRDQDGFKTTIHVRLVHAFVRRMALKSGHWDSDAWGLPINQGDLLFQVVGFTWLLLRSLERMGYRVTAQEQAEYYQLWRYIGAVLGVDAELLPLINEQDCGRLWDLWMLTNPGPDENSVKLSLAALKAVSTGLGGGWAAEHVQYPLLCGAARWLLGDHICDGLGLPKTFFSNLLPLTYRPAVQVSELFDTRLPYQRAQTVANAVKGMVTNNAALGIMPEGTGVVAEPDRLRNLAEFAPVDTPAAAPQPAQPEQTSPPEPAGDAPTSA